MQSFDHEPLESELAHLLDPAGRSWSLSAQDTRKHFLVRPSNFFLQWGIFGAGVPSLFFGWAVMRGLIGWDSFGIGIFILAIVATLGIIWLLNQKEVSKGNFFVLDKVRRVLILCRQDCEFKQAQIISFVEVQAWHQEEDSEEVLNIWLGELSVLVHGDIGKTMRYPVVTSANTRLIHWVASKLTDFYGVELRILRMDRKTRRRLAQRKNSR